MTYLITQNSGYTLFTYGPHISKALALTLLLQLRNRVIKTRKILAGFAFVITDQRCVNLQECEEYVEKLLIYSLIQGLLNNACINSLTYYTWS
jgi:hypothetical protein